MSALEHLIHGDFNERWGATKSLKQLGEAVHPELIALAKSSETDPEVLSFVAEILGENPTPAVIETLIELLHQSSDDDLNESIIRVLAQHEPGAVESLLIRCDRPTLRPVFLKALLELNRPSSIEILLRFSQHADSSLRILSFEGLGQFHAPAISQVLIEGLSDVDPTVRRLCLQALGLRKSESLPIQKAALISVIAPLLCDLNEAVCQQAAKTLGRMNHPLAIETLWSRLKDPLTPRSLMPSFIFALGWAHHPQGIKALLSLLQDIASDRSDFLKPEPWPTGLIEGAIQTLGAVPVPSLQAEITSVFLLLLESKEPPFDLIAVQIALVMAIAQLHQEAAITPLIQNLRRPDERLRLHIIATLKQINPTLSHQFLLAIAQDLATDSDLANGIAIALQEW